MDNGAEVHLVGLREPELEVAVKELGPQHAFASVGPADLTLVDHDTE